MSTLSVSNITTPSNTTPLVLSSANSQAAFVRVEAANNDIVFGGTTKFLGTLAASYLQSNSINVAFDVANAAFDIANTVSGDVITASFNTANAAYGLANTSSASLGSNWAVTNTVYGVANAAFASANNVAPQVTPAFNTANAAYNYANSSYTTLNNSLSSNWTVTNTVYGVANTALPNTSSSTLAGTLTVSTSGVPQVINSTNSNTYKVALRDNGTAVGYFGGSSSNPFIVANSSVATLFSVDSVGNFATTGTLTTSSRGIAKASMPSGCILQVQQTFWDGVATLAVSSFTDHPNLSVAITPTSATSKVLVMISMQAVVYNVTMQARFTRNGTPIGIAAAASSRVLSTFGGLQTIGDGNHQFTTWNYQYLDSPATTSALTYRIQLKMQGGATAYLNRSVNDADNTDWAQRTTSSITVMEIAQ
jgi:hypothetical protein